MNAKKIRRALMATEIYCDGSCLGNPGRGGWAYVVIKDGCEEYRDFGGVPDVTNNQMELMAAIKALTYWQQSSNEPVTVVTDSSYVINGITEWIDGWIKKGWMGSTGKSVANKSYWEQLYALRDNVSWRWVKGHSGNEHNELVDILAKTGASSVLPKTQG
jgi:ribonuclease HI